MKQLTVSEHAIQRFQLRSPGAMPWRIRAILRDLAARGARHVTASQIEIHASYQEVALVLIVKGGAVVTVLPERTGA